MCPTSMTDPLPKNWEDWQENVTYPWSSTFPHAAPTNTLMSFTADRFISLV